jgi:hypothetical protein
LKADVAAKATKVDSLEKTNQNFKIERDELEVNLNQVRLRSKFQSNHFQKELDALKESNGDNIVSNLESLMVVQLNDKIKGLEDKVKELEQKEDNIKGLQNFQAESQNVEVLEIAVKNSLLFISNSVNAEYLNFDELSSEEMANNLLQLISSNPSINHHHSEENLNSASPKQPLGLVSEIESMKNTHSKEIESLSSNYRVEVDALNQKNSKLKEEFEVLQFQLEMLRGGDNLQVDSKEVVESDNQVSESDFKTRLALEKERYDQLAKAFQKQEMSKDTVQLCFEDQVKDFKIQIASRKILKF